MNKLTSDAKDIILLYQRSKKDNDGWAIVSIPIWPLMSSVPSELIELQGNETTGGRARLTEHGKIVADYLT